MIVKNRSLYTLFFLLCVALAQPLYVPSVYAMGAGAGADEQPQQTLTEQARAAAHYVAHNKVRTTCALVPFLNLKAYGLADATTAALQLAPKFQEVMFGDEDATDAAIIQLIRNELQCLNVPDHNSIPIKKKTGRFESAYESIIVHPTNKIIYLDEDFLKRQTPELKAFIIKTALKHYLNGTFGKVSLMQLSFAVAGMKVVPKAQSALRQLIRGLFSQPTDGTEATSTSTGGSTFAQRVGGFAVDMAVTIGTVYAWKRARGAVVKAYVRRTQCGFDRQEVPDKARAKRLLGAVADDAQRLAASGVDQRMQPRSDERHDALRERLNPHIEDELSAEWGSLMEQYAQLDKSNPASLVRPFNDFFKKVPKSDKRKKQAAAIIEELMVLQTQNMKAALS